MLSRRYLLFAHQHARRAECPKIYVVRPIVATAIVLALNESTGSEVVSGRASAVE
jgi:hypothetical protein